MLTQYERQEFARVSARRAFRQAPRDHIERSQTFRAKRRASGLCVAELSLEDLLLELPPIAGGVSYATVTLDTTAPAGVTVSVNSGASHTSDDDVVLTIATSDNPTTGYTMKIYGDVSDTFDTANYRAVEANAPWVAYATSKNVRLSTGEGSKTVRIKVRDDVWNVSGEQTDAITVDTTIPTVSVTSGPTVAKISKVTGKDQTEITWESDADFDEYKVKVVPATGSTEAAGTLIPTTGGSTNTSGAAGGYPDATPIVTLIDGTDLETAGAEGANIVKVFVKEVGSGNWSV